jgi:hypothetical protein
MEESMEQREGYKVERRDAASLQGAPDAYESEMDVWMFEVGKPCPRCGLIVEAEADGRPRVHTWAICIELLRVEVERLRAGWRASEVLRDRLLARVESGTPAVVKAMQEHIEDLRKMLFAE